MTNSGGKEPGKQEQLYPAQGEQEYADKIVKLVREHEQAARIEELEGVYGQLPGKARGWNPENVLGTVNGKLKVATANLRDDILSNYGRGEPAHPNTTGEEE